MIVLWEKSSCNIAAEFVKTEPFQVRILVTAEHDHVVQIYECFEQAAQPEMPDNPTADVGRMRC